MSTAVADSTAGSTPDCLPAATSWRGASFLTYAAFAWTQSGVIPFSSLPSSQAMIVGSSASRSPVNGLRWSSTCRTYCWYAARASGSV